MRRILAIAVSVTLLAIVHPAQAEAATRCGAPALKASVGRIDAGAGQRHAPLTLKNVSSRTCSLRGYPGLIMLDSHGDALRTRVGRDGGSAHRVTLKPGQRATALLHWTTVETGSERTCPDAAKLLVIPPDDYGYLVTAFPADHVCDQGRLGVTPFGR
ncbi:DUF4232 domain-containing protein [Nonomuraea sp. NPDC050556]|uniref:DUF4232 domain-containing protein n=1 Tax=Nonomuraea sp. NPDC050556 TaxID=3364369 RepID=UPI0037AB1A2E